jgi:hypothetical protein
MLTSKSVKDCRLNPWDRSTIRISGHAKPNAGSIDPSDYLAPKKGQRKARTGGKKGLSPAAKSASRHRNRNK